MRGFIFAAKIGKSNVVNVENVGNVANKNGGNVEKPTSRYPDIFLTVNSHKIGH